MDADEDIGDFDDYGTHVVPDVDPENSDDEAIEDADDPLADAQAQLEQNIKEATGGYHAVPRAGDIAIDLVTRQVVYVESVLADTVVEYFEAEGFDLWSYKAHPYLPVRHDDTVYGVVYVERSLEKLHDAGKIYPTPRGRLARVPVELAEVMR